MANQVTAASSTSGSRFDVRLRYKRPGATSDSFELSVDFQLDPGINILFGPSVAGKYTLLYCIAGLLKPSIARIALDHDLLQDSDAQIFLPPQRRHLAYLFQAPALFPHLTV